MPGGPVDAPAEMLERVSPFAELMFLIMAADGRLCDEEQAAMRGAFRALTGGRFSTRLLADMMVDFAAALEREGREERLEAVCNAFANDRGDAEAAFRLAAAMSLVDGDLDAAEASLLDQLAQWLGLGKDTAAALLRIQRDLGCG